MVLTAGHRVEEHALRQCAKQSGAQYAQRHIHIKPAMINDANGMNNYGTGAVQREELLDKCGIDVISLEIFIDTPQLRQAPTTIRSWLTK